MLWHSAAAEGARPDVVLLDVFMPDMNGWEVLAALRGDRRTADLPIYLVSAHDPAERLPGSRVFLGAMGDEISIPRLLRCSLAISTILLLPDGAPDPGFRQAP
jgi:CheY-like chemotaxis protein